MITTSIQNVRIVLVGLSCTGTSSTAKELLRRIGAIPYINAGNFMREKAEKQGMKVGDYAKYMDDHKELCLDKEIDEAMLAAGRQNSNGIFEGRLAAPFIEGAYNVYQACDRLVRGDRRHAELLAKNPSLTETAQEVLLAEERRDAIDKKRYIENYGPEIIWTPDMYHLVVDTTYNNIAEVADEVMEGFQLWHDAGRIPGPVKREGVLVA